MVDFLIIGPRSAYAYKNIFILIKDENIMVGYNRESMYFDNNEKGVICRWFSSISDYCPPKLELKRQYKEEDFRKFDNLDIINIDRIEDILSDYQDIMGVPLSFLDKWNRDQFEIVGLLSDNKGDGIYIFNGTETYTDERHKKSKCGVIDGKRIYCRLLIKKKIS